MVWMKWRQALLAPTGLRGRSWGSARGRSSRLRPRSRCGSIPTAYPRGARRTRASPAGRASRGRSSAGSPEDGSPDGSSPSTFARGLAVADGTASVPPPALGRAGARPSRNARLARDLHDFGRRVSPHPIFVSLSVVFVSLSVVRLWRGTGSGAPLGEIMVRNRDGE